MIRNFFRREYKFNKNREFYKNLIFTIFVLIGFFNFSVFANEIEIDEEEIKSTSSSGEKIEFLNYNGTHSVIDSASSIRGIGTNLGKELAQDTSTTRTISEGQKYSVIHAISENSDSTTLLNADIFILSEDAGVDHIKNLRRIIAGFLSSAYGYSDDDSDTIAIFITVYNAVYRGQFKDFTQKYQPIVLQNLDENFSGLSNNWEDWAGKTQIVIPLKNLVGLPSIDTSSISDENVITSLQQENDKAIEEREKLSDIKEREMLDADKNAQNAQKDATKKRNEGDAEGAKQSSKIASEQQQFVDKTRSEIQSERETIEKDKAEVEKNQSETNFEIGLFGSSKKGLYYLAKVSLGDGKILYNSPMKQVRNKAVFEVLDITLEAEGKTEKFSKMYLAICGENSGKSAVKLCLIGDDDLTIKKESSQILSETSDLIPYKNDFLVVIKDGKDFFIALFDKNLELKAKSSVAINQNSPINLIESGILVTNSKGNPAFLDAKTLSSIW